MTAGLLGKKFGNWLCIWDSPIKGQVLCRCVCLKDKMVWLSGLKSGKTKSCGCVSYAERAIKSTKSKGIYPSEWSSWHHAKQRCTNSSQDSYHRYGGRGIKMCDRWMNSFDNFLKDMGPRPPGTSLDRKNNSKDYEPGNCRWATREEQHNNTRRNVFLDFNGRRMTVSQWARFLKIPAQCLFNRLGYGWSVKKALTTEKLIYDKRNKANKTKT